MYFLILFIRQTYLSLNDLRDFQEVYPTVTTTGQRDTVSMENVESCVPPGFRFHPTEEELVGYYLKRKVDSLKIDLDIIADIDLYRMEPWDIEDRCRLGYEEQNEWYFFSHKDRKYPTGTRTNRATAAGFWKATGRDKAVLSKDKIIGMRKTLVFYNGRAPNGRKSDWIMHEYRIQSSEHGLSQEEGWVVCRAFKKPSPSHKQGFEAWSNGYYFRNNASLMPTSSSQPLLNPNQVLNLTKAPFISPQTLSSNPSYFDNNHLIPELPQLDSPTVSTSLATNEDCVNQIQYDDWGNLFESKLGQSTSSFTFPNMPLITSNDELDPQNQISHFLGCFSNL